MNSLPAQLHRLIKKYHPSQLSRQQWAVAAAMVVLFVISSIASFAYFTYTRINVGQKQPVAFSQSDPDEPEKPRAFNIALMGYGGGGHEGGLLTDSIMVVSIDPNRQKIFMISVPRDLWVSFPVVEGEDESYWKINAAFAIGSDDGNYRRKPKQFTGEAGGGELAKYVLQKVIGQEIDRFVALDFEGFKRSIEVLDGVDVEVLRSFNDELYPIAGREDETCGKSEEEVAATATIPAHLAEQEFPCRFEHLYFPQGLIHMDGETALKYARSRHSAQDGGDFNRAARQRQVILAVKNRILKLNFIPKIIPFVSTLASHLTTDISLADMQAMIERQEEFLDYEIVGIAMTTDENNILKFGVSSSGQSIVIPKAGIDQWEAVHQWLEQQMEQQPPLPDAGPASGSARTVEVVVERPAETIDPDNQPELELSTLRLEPSTDRLELEFTGEYDRDRPLYVLLKDEHGAVVPGQSEVSYSWSLADPSVVEIDTEVDGDDDCYSGVVKPCPNMRAIFKTNRAADVKLDVTANYRGQQLSLPTPVTIVVK
jgi:LCP family protein required for cell wall assembly